MLRWMYSPRACRQWPSLRLISAQGDAAPAADVAARWTGLPFNLWEGLFRIGLEGAAAIALRTIARGTEALAWDCVSTLSIRDAVARRVYMAGSDDQSESDGNADHARIISTDGQPVTRSLWVCSEETSESGVEKYILTYP